MLPKQAQKLLDFIHKHKKEHDGNAPPHRLMFLAIDAHSSNASAYWVDFLVEEGLLTKKRGKLCVIGARWIPPMEKLDWGEVKDILEFNLPSFYGYTCENDVGHTLKDLHELLDPYLEQEGRKKRPTRCAWKRDGDHWETQCDDAFQFADGTPAENNMLFCPYCGLKIEQLNQDEKGE